MAHTVKKWGNSLGLRIPATIAAQMHIHVGTSVDLHVRGAVLTVRVARSRHRKSSHLTLADLVARINSKNLQPTYNWEDDVGKEVIS